MCRLYMPFEIYNYLVCSQGGNTDLGHRFTVRTETEESEYLY